jgi:hypothetical protein
VSRVAILRNPELPASSIEVDDRLAAGKTLGMHPFALPVTSAAKLECAFETTVRERADLLLLALWAYREHIQATAKLYCKTAKRANLPVEQPTKFDLVFNPKTAKALGTLPQALVLQADEIIE